MHYISVEIGACLGYDLVGFELVYHEEVAVGYIVHRVIDKKAFAASEAQQYLAAFVNVYLGIWFLPLRVEQTEALGFGGVFYRVFAAVEIAFHCFAFFLSDENSGFVAINFFNYIYYITK